MANQDDAVTALKLTEQEEQDLLEFLQALTQSTPLDTVPERVPSGRTPGGER